MFCKTVTIDLNFRIHFYSNGIEVFNPEIVSDGQQHIISVKKEGNDITLDVNGVKISNTYPDMDDSELMAQLQKMDFYLGGLPDTVEGKYLPT